MKIYLDSKDPFDKELIEKLFGMQFSEKPKSREKTFSELTTETKTTQPTCLPEKEAVTPSESPLEPPKEEIKECVTPQTMSHPEPQQEKEEALSSPNLEELQNLVRKIGGANKARLVEIKEWLVTKGVSKLSELPEKDYQEAYDYLKTLEG